MGRKTDRDEILDSSTALFRRKGLRGTSMADIANATGLIKGSIYHYFPSKDALVLEVLDRANQRFEQGAFSLAYDDSRPAVDRLRALLDYITQYFHENKICLMAHLSLEDKNGLPSAQDKIRVFFRRWREALCHILTPVHGPEQAARLAEDTICRIEGGAIWLHLFDDAAALERACEEAMALLVTD
jgi:AcrR family transcriptional regulator